MQSNIALDWNFIHFLCEPAIIIASDSTIIGINNAAKIKISINDDVSSDEAKRILHSYFKNIDEIASSKAVYDSNTTTWAVATLSDNLDHMVYLLIEQQSINNTLGNNKLQNLETLIMNTPGNIYWMDTNCRMLGCNQNVLDMLGLTMEEYIGTTYEELAVIANWKHGQGEAYKNADLKVMSTGEPIYNIEDIPLPHKKGEMLHLLTNRVPLKDASGQIVGVAGISIDITDRKIAEKQLIEAKGRAEVANQAKSYFMASLGHEFRTPLNNIIGLAEIIKNSMDKLSISEVEDYANNIRAAGFDLLELINDVIMFSRLETGHFKIEKTQISLLDIINRVVNSSMHRAKEKNLELIIDYPSTLPTNVLGDAQRIRQILMNLIDNALKFTEEGYIKVTVNQDDKSMEHLVITVEDTGIGIASDKCNLVFERFSQVHSANTDQRMGKYKGVGLGLAIVKQLVELMGGTIRLESTLDHGSKFTFSLPTTETQSSATPVLEDEQTAITKNRQHNNKILAVEDNLLTIRFLEFILEKFHLEYDIAKSGGEALRLLAKNSYRFILMDLGLPDINGLECIQQYKEMKTDNEKSPIVILTAQGVNEGGSSAMFSSVYDYIEKPLTDSALANLLKKY